MLKDNRLTIDFQKSNLITCNFSKNKKDEKMDVFLDGKKIDKNDHAKYLSVFIDRNLAWNKQIEETNVEMSKGIGILKKMRNYLQTKTLKDSYSPLIKLFVDYRSLVWVMTPKTLLNKTARNIKKAIRIMVFKLSKPSL